VHVQPSYGDGRTESGVTPDRRRQVDPGLPCARDGAATHP
jgi:hypothetical protein